MTQEIYQKAMKFAGVKHCKQTVPGTTANYLLHISNVTMEILVAYYHSQDFDLDFAIQLAILHDTIEDTDATFQEINNVFSERVANGVLALTKNDELTNKDEKILDSLNRINLLEKEVGMVKIADRITNLQKPPSTWNKEKIKSYLKQSEVIKKLLTDKNEFLYIRLNKKIDEYKKHFTTNESTK